MSGFSPSTYLLLKATGGGGGEGGTTNYNDLQHKPKLNGVELRGDKTLSQFGIPAISDDSVAENTVWSSQKVADRFNEVDVGLATRMAIDLSNIDEAGVNKIKELAGEVSPITTKNYLDVTYQEVDSAFNNKEEFVVYGGNYTYRLSFKEGTNYYFSCLSTNKNRYMALQSNGVWSGITTRTFAQTTDIPTKLSQLENDIMIECTQAEYDSIVDKGNKYYFITE